MKIKYSISFILLVLVFQLQSQTVIDKVIAKVGSEIILLSEVEDEYSYARSSNPQIDESAKCQILESIISQKLIVYQAKLDSVEVSDDEVQGQLDLRFDHILRQMNGDEEFFKEYYGATVKEMKERFKEDQQQKILAERMQQELIQSVSITPKEVLDFFNSIPTDSLPFLNSEVEIGELVVKPQVNAEERALALEKITDIRKQIVEGASFDELAKKYSADTESAKRGGDLGFAKRGAYVPEFESAAYSLEPDELSEIVDTDFGFHIMKLTERRGNVIKIKHILISPTITSDDEDLAMAKLDSVRSLILSDSISFEAAVKKYGMKDYPSFSNSGKIRNPMTGDNFFETKDLDPDTYFAIEDMEIGDVSEVMTIPNPRGGKLFRIITLQSRSKPHRVNLKQDYSKIAMFAKENKKSEYFSTWIQEKIKNTLIDIDPLYSGCPNLISITQR